MYKQEPSFPKAHYVLEWEDAGDIPIKLKLPFNSDFKLVLSQLFPAFLNCISFSSKFLPISREQTEKMRL